MILYRPTGRTEFELVRAGGMTLRELWVPAEDPDDFNAAIVGRIEVVAAYKDGNRVSEWSL